MHAAPLAGEPENHGSNIDFMITIDKRKIKRLIPEEAYRIHAKAAQAEVQKNWGNTRGHASAWQECRIERNKNGVRLVSR